MAKFKAMTPEHMFWYDEAFTREVLNPGGLAEPPIGIGEIEAAQWLLDGEICSGALNYLQAEGLVARFTKQLDQIEEEKI